MVYQLAVGEIVTLQVTFVDASDNPAVIDPGGIKWSITDPTIASIISNLADMTKANVRAIGKVGQIQVQASAYANGVTVIALFDLEAIAAAAVSGTISPVS